MSATVPGYFDCSKLLEVKAKVEQIWKGGNLDADYVPDVEGAVAILENQTADLKILEVPEKDYDLKVWWNDDCDDTDPEACTDSCAISGEEIGDNCQNYQLDECFEKSFKITERRFRTSNNSKEEVMARAMLRKMKLMDEYWAAKALAHLNASAGVNKYAGQHTVVGTETRIAAPSWNPDVFGYIDTVLWKNKMKPGRMISGTLLKQYYWKIGMETTDPTGASANAKMTSFGVPYFDRRMDDILGDKSLIMFDPNAVAMATKAEWAEYDEAGGRMVDIEGGGRQRWQTIKSNSLPGVKYDFAYQEICSGNDISHFVKIRTKGGLFLNPIGCDSDRTGVLKFVCL